MASGQLEKMLIIAFSDKERQSEVGKYTFQYNPENYAQKYEIKYEEEQPDGATEADLRFKAAVPQELSLKFLFDATGASPAATAAAPEGEIKDVYEELKKFRELVWDYHGDNHQPRYLRLLWGKLDFECRLTTLNVSYTLFKPDGTPLRATVDTTFKKSIEKPKENASNDASSPDLTHLVTVKAGETLPNLSTRIYGTPDYYLEVARVNSLDNFREIEPGTQLVFPPLDKESIAKQ